MRKIFACLAMFALSGCSFMGSSPKTHFYALTPVDTGGVVRNASPARPVTVAAVHIPPSLDRNSMVLHTQANTVAISGTDRWTGPVGPMARRVLTEDLAAHLPRASVVLPDAPAPRGTRQIVVTMLRFGPVDGGGVVLDANWAMVAGNNGEPVLRRDVQLRESSAGRGAAAVAAAMSRLLARLAGQMAKTLTAS